MQDSQRQQEEYMRNALRVQECMRDGGSADACYSQHMQGATQ